MYTRASPGLPVRAIYESAERSQVHAVDVVSLAGFLSALEARQALLHPGQPGVALDHHVIHLVAAQDLDPPLEGGVPEELPHVERALRHLYPARRPLLQQGENLQDQTAPADDRVRFGGVGGDADAREVLREHDGRRGNLLTESREDGVGSAPGRFERGRRGKALRNVYRRGEGKMKRRIAALLVAALVSSSGAAACSGVQDQLEKRAQEEVDKGRQRIEKEVQKGQKQVEEQIDNERRQVEKEVEKGRQQVEKRVQEEQQRAGEGQ